MGRRSHNQHIERSREYDGHVAEGGARRCKVTAWCGDYTTSYVDEHSSTYGYQKHAVNACSKCAKKYWTQYNKDNKVPYTFGDNVAGQVATDSPVYKSFRYYKSSYPVLNAEGDTVAYVAINNGWGCSWELHVQQMHYGQVSLNCPGYGETFWEGEGDKKTYYTYKNFSCKEEVLKDIDAYIRHGKTLPMKVINERIEAYKVRRAQELADQKLNEERAQKHREELEAKRASDREAMRVRLKELLDNPFLGNYDRDTIFELAKLAGYSQEAINA